MNAEKTFQYSHTPIDPAKYQKSIFEMGRCRIIENMIPPGNNRSALDIGSGSGFFSKMLSERGWTTVAVDTDQENITILNNAKIEAYLGDAIGVLKKLPTNNYDLILALEIIEHMPKEYGITLLKETRKRMKPRGRLLISTPNIMSIEALGAYYWGEKIRGWEKWNAWDVTHVHIYSSLEIIRIVKLCGFSINRITGYWYKGRLPIIGRWGLPLLKTTHFPLNLFGFNIILECKAK